MEKVDARGQACPLPVVRAKRALSEMDEGELEVLVDNETAVKNLEALATTLKLASSREERAEGVYAVRFMKDAGGEGVTAMPMEASISASASFAAVPARGGAVAVISSEYMGAGDDELGRTLMKGFVFALLQLDELPSSVLLYNGGVKLACEGSEALVDLRALVDAGVEVLSCGTCLQHYGLTEQLAVGQPTNMYVIVEKQAAARVVVRP